MRGFVSEAISNAGFGDTLILGLRTVVINIHLMKIKV